MKNEFENPPEGATHWDPVDENWLRQCYLTSRVLIGSDWSAKSWQYPDDLSKMPRLVCLNPDTSSSVEWYAKGMLPPVGTEFEITTGSSWRECIAVAHDQGFVVFRSYGKAGDYPLYGHAYADKKLIRPIRTAEQVAAYDRDKAIHDLMGTACVTMVDAARIYDAGYRKQVTE